MAHQLSLSVALLDYCGRWSTSIGHWRGEAREGHRPHICRFTVARAAGPVGPCGRGRRGAARLAAVTQTCRRLSSARHHWRSGHCRHALLTASLRPSPAVGNSGFLKSNPTCWPAASPPMEMMSEGRKGAASREAHALSAENDRRRREGERGGGEESACAAGRPRRDEATTGNTKSQEAETLPPLVLTVDG
jgi:hypothetical protein